MREDSVIFFVSSVPHRSVIMFRMQQGSTLPHQIGSSLQYRPVDFIRTENAPGFPGT